MTASLVNNDDRHVGNRAGSALKLHLQARRLSTESDQQYLKRIIGELFAGDGRIRCCKEKSPILTAARLVISARKVVPATIVTIDPSREQHALLPKSAIETICFNQEYFIFRCDSMFGY